MKIRELAQHWDQNAAGRMSPTSHVLHLDLESEARLAALIEMYIAPVLTLFDRIHGVEPDSSLESLAEPASDNRRQLSILGLPHEAVSERSLS